MPCLTRVHTLVEAWYPGEEHGNAPAAVLFGDVDPSGRLPVTFPTGADRVPAMGSLRYPAGPAGYNYDEGLKVGYRAYEANSLSVLFPFGYGVSYTSFAFSKLSVRSAGAAVQVAFTVTNTGSRDGVAVPQVYIRFPHGVGEPPQQLKAFARPDLQPHEARRITLTLSAHAFEYWSSGHWRSAPGDYRISIGSSSRNLLL